MPAAISPSLLAQNKTPRWQVAPQQHDLLEQTYAITRFPSADTRKQLATMVKATSLQVQVWFQNRRQRERKLSKLDTTAPDDLRSGLVESNDEAGDALDQTRSAELPLLSSLSDIHDDGQVSTTSSDDTSELKPLPLMRSGLSDVTAGLAIEQRKTPTCDEVDERPETQHTPAKDSSACAAEQHVQAITRAHEPFDVIYVSAAWQRLCGYTSEQVIGETLKIIQGPKTSAHAVETMLRAVRQRTSATIKLVNYTRDGRPFWHRLHVEPLRDHAGEVQFFQASSSDIAFLESADDSDATAFEMAASRLLASPSPDALGLAGPGGESCVAADSEQRCEERVVSLQSAKRFAFRGVPHESASALHMAAESPEEALGGHGSIKRSRSSLELSDILDLIE
eukprot:CAMPEP_0119380298 /NCGR_PEP_ID=MMETSP1334-20130426/56303_1 /TAXON_ID=127549 /ORGANISM="Calcidiscus leptoporus, Strain RCC1130" /LENGTH=394 /DNA_ID=CAMNT_0007400065 /DNA_START=33 /DNA_END=1217 /DNA_ORIENTATION=+